MNREDFIKGQKESVLKALTKEKVPLKQKHARRLILGTHHEKSSAIFWKNVTAIHLEMHPVLTWKFCHLLHNLIRDGHESVPAESLRHLNRMSMLIDFWKNQLQIQGYGPANGHYCKMLCDRLEFHRKYPQILGNLVVSEIDLSNIPSDVAFDISLEILEQLENLILLQRKVFNALRALQITTITPQAQTLLSPLICAISDASKLCDLLTKLLFLIESDSISYASVRLSRHFHEFVEVFRRTYSFYEEMRRLEFISSFIDVPTLPDALFHCIHTGSSALLSGDFTHRSSEDRDADEWALSLQQGMSSYDTAELVEDPSANLQLLMPD